MYALLWRSLPGPWPVKALLCLALLKTRGSRVLP